MTSTVLDVGVFLLLVSAGVLSLVAVDEPLERSTRGEEVGDAVDVLATTATVTFDPRAPKASDGAGGGSVRDGRRVHGSLRVLLAEATVASAGIGDAVVDPNGPALARAVERAVASRLGPNAQVIARWEPVAGADFGGEVTVGAEPPEDRPVHTAVVSVPTPFAPANAGGPSAVRAFAREFVAARFPPDEMDAALGRDDASATHAASRYRQASAAVLGDESAVANATPEEANAVIACGLAKRLSNGRGETASDRASEAAPNEPNETANGFERRGTAPVRLVVRRW